MAGEAISAADNISSVQLKEQGSTPSTPSSGYSRVFAKADGLYIVDDAGAVTGPLVAVTDAGGLTYTPSTVADWDGGSDPGDLDDALNQLAERVKDVETVTLQAPFRKAAADEALDGNYLLPILVGAQDAAAGLYIPTNVGTLTKAVIAFLPDATETNQFDLYVSYAANGEAQDTHTDTALNETVSATADQVAEHDISSHLGSLAGGHYLTVRVNADTSNVLPYMLVLEFTVS